MYICEITSKTHTKNTDDNRANVFASYSPAGFGNVIVIIIYT